MSIGLVLRAILKIPLTLNGKELEIIRVSTTPAECMKDDFYPGWRPATKEELSRFAKKYKPSRWYYTIYGVEGKSVSTIFGPLVRTYKTKGKEVEQAVVNPIWGFHPQELVLFVKR